MKIRCEIERSLFALILYVLTTITNATPLVSPIVCQSRVVSLYNSTIQLPGSTTSNFTRMFNVTFTNPPIIAISNAGYYSLDQLYNQLWGITYTTFVNLTGMRIHARVEINTRTNVLFVSYFAMDGGFQNDLFRMYSIQYSNTQLVNTSVGNGNRIDRLRFQPSPLTYFNTNSYIYHVTNILHMRNSATFNFIISVQFYQQFNSTINQTFSKSFTITVNSTQTRLQVLGLWIIVVNPNQISYQNYYQVFVGSISITSANTSLNFYDINVSRSSVGLSTVNVEDIWQAGMMMGFSTWGSDPYLGSGFRWAWLNDTNGTTYVKVFNNNRIGRINYNFLIFGQVDCPLFWSVANQSCATECASNQVVDADKPACRPCSVHCSTCSVIPSNCTRCQSGYYLANNSCFFCECGYVPPPTPTPTPTPIPPTIENNPYWLVCLGIIPLAAVGILCYCRYKRIHTTIAMEKTTSFKQHPSIQF